MARKTSVVLLLALASVLGFTHSGAVTVHARGGFEYIGNDGMGVGSLVGEVQLGAKPRVDLMYVVKDTGGATRDGQGEALIFLKSVAESSMKGDTLFIAGQGTFQGDTRRIELSIVDSNA